MHSSADEGNEAIVKLLLPLCHFGLACFLACTRGRLTIDVIPLYAVRTADPPQKNCVRAAFPKPYKTQKLKNLKTETSRT